MRAFQSGAFQTNAFQIINNYAVVSITLDDIAFNWTALVASNTLSVTLDDISFKTIAWFTDYPASATWTNQSNTSATWTVQPPL